MKKIQISLFTVFVLIVFVVYIVVVKKSAGSRATIPDPNVLVAGTYDLTTVKPYLLLMNASDFSIDKIDLTLLKTQDFSQIAEARAFMMNGQYKLALATFFEPRLIILRSSDPSLKDLKEEFVDNFPDGAGRVRAVYVGDVNGDGKDEVVAGTRPDGILKYYQYDNGKWTATQIDNLGATIHDILITDSEGNNKKEVFVTMSTTLEKIYDTSGVKIPEIIKYTLTRGVWNKTVVWKPEKPQFYGGSTYSHPRYLFTGDFDGDGKPEIVSGVVGNYELHSLLMLKWNGNGYSQYLQDVSANVKLEPGVITTGDVDNDGRSEVLVPTLAGDTILMYKWQGNHWKTSVLARDLVDDNGTNEYIISMTVLNSLSGGYKKILYETQAEKISDNVFDKFYVLSYNSKTKVWERSQVGKFSLPAYYSWGFFPLSPWSIPQK